MLCTYCNDPIRVERPYRSARGGEPFCSLLCRLYMETVWYARPGHCSNTVPLKGDLPKPKHMEER